MTGCCWFEFFLISALKSACPLFCLAKHSKRLTHDSGTVLLLGMVPGCFFKRLDYNKGIVGKGGVLMYSFYEYLAFFVIYAFLGWCAEVIFNTINTGPLCEPRIFKRSGLSNLRFWYGNRRFLPDAAAKELAAVVFWLHVFDQRCWNGHRLRAEKGVSHQLVGLFQSAF